MMHITDLGERETKILQSIVEFIKKSCDDDFMIWLGADGAYMRLRDKIETSLDEVEHLYKYLPEFGFGVIDDIGFRTDDKYALKEFLQNGGVHRFIESENQKIAKEINKKINEDNVKARQNRNQNLYWLFTLIIAFLAFLVSISSRSK